MPRSTGHGSLVYCMRRITPSIMLFVLVFAVGTGLNAQVNPDAAALEPGKPVERELAGTAAHSYRLDLTAGQYFSLVVMQKGVDVALELFGPDGKKLTEVDSPNGTSGPEPLAMIVSATGSYRLTVSSLNADAAPGRYEVTLTALRTATAEDRISEQADVVFEEAYSLADKNTTESFRAALVKYQQALTLYQTARNVRRQARTLANLGYVYRGLNDLDQALTLYRKAISLYRAVPDREQEADLLNTTGVIHESVGQFQRSLDAYLQALTLARELGEKSRIAAVQLNLGALYYRLGSYRQAISYLQESIANAHVSSDTGAEANALMNLGNVYDKIDDAENALASYEGALVIVRKVKSRRSEAKVLTNIADVYQNMGQPNKALEIYRQALELKRALGARPSEAYTLQSMGTNFLLLGDTTQALAHFQQALVIYREFHNQEGVAGATFGLAQVERKTGQLTEALAHIKESIKITESLRSNIGSQDLRASFLATVQYYYRLQIDLLMLLHQRSPSAGHAGEALQVSERARARALLDILAESGADIRQGISPALLARERSLQQQLNAKAQAQMTLLAGRHTDEQATTLAREIEALTTEFQQVQATIREESPNYAALTQPQPLSLAEIQTKLLDPDTLLLEYSLGEERSFLWAVTRDSLQSFELPKRAEIESVAKRYYELLNTRNVRITGETTAQRHERVARSERELPDASLALSRLVLGPVAAELGNKRLVIVADGVLQYIPFGALTDPERFTAATPKPLIVRHEIVSLPSGSTLAAIRHEVAGRAPAPKMIAALADPVFMKSDARLTSARGRSRPASRTAGERLGSENARLLVQTAGETNANDGLYVPRLPGSREEATRIVTMFPAATRRLALDFAADRKLATSPELGQFRYLHFSTHGFLNSEHPELSGVVFSLVNNRGVAQDGFLRAHEVFNLRLPAELVVLSACQTGIGKEVQGEGVVSLTRGFMYAGSPRVIVSLWSVSDQGTTELMVRLYQGMLKQGLRPAAALRAAQVSLMTDSRWASPYYWAPFILQGEWR